jgi:MFS family permease
MILVAYLFREPLKNKFGQVTASLKTGHWFERVKNWTEKKIAISHRIRELLASLVARRQGVKEYRAVMAVIFSFAVIIFIAAFLPPIPASVVKWTFGILGVFFGILLITTPIFIWAVYRKKTGKTLSYWFSVISVPSIKLAVLGISVYFFFQAKSRYFLEEWNWFWENHQELAWGASALAVLFAVVLAWQWITDKSMPGLYAFGRLGGFSPRLGTLLGVLATFFVLNVGLYWYDPDLWFDTWRIKEIRTSEVVLWGPPFLTPFSFTQTREVIVYGWSFWAFWLTQALGVVVIYYLITTTKKNVKLGAAMITGALFLGIAFLLANNGPGKFKEKLETVEISKAEEKPRIATPPQEERWVSIGFPGRVPGLTAETDLPDSYTLEVRDVAQIGDTLTYNIWSKYGRGKIGWANLSREGTSDRFLGESYRTDTERPSSIWLEKTDWGYKGEAEGKLANGREVVVPIELRRVE